MITANRPATFTAPTRRAALPQSPMDQVTLGASTPLQLIKPFPQSTTARPAATETALQVAAVSTPVVGAALAALIDHTLLKPDARSQDIRKLCAEARENGFASVCVNPGQVALACKELEGSNVMVCTVVGFPLGATTTATKAAETRDAIANGADEIDMVINVGALKDGDVKKVREDIAAVVEAAQGHTVKVILETGLLTREEKVLASRLSVEAGAHFVKTSTGFGPGAATVEDIALMRATVGPDVGVKASGGVRDFAAAQAMIAAGATRIGTSSGIAIVAGVPTSDGGY